MNRLYRITTHGEMISRPDKPDGYADVTIHWFRDGRVAPAYSYAEVIPGWSDMVYSTDPWERNPGYANRLSSYIDQLFTEQEADIVQRILIRSRISDIQIEEVEIPVTNYEIPYRAIPAEPEAGDGYGFVELQSSPDFPLPFKVSGYFDTLYPNAFQRYQVAIVKSLVERAGLAVTDESALTKDIDGLCERLSALRAMLIDLQRSLNMLNREMPNENN